MHIKLVMQNQIYITGIINVYSKINVVQNFANLCSNKRIPIHKSMVVKLSLLKIKP